jgi:DNA-binding FadR family transcriptional regulator
MSAEPNEGERKLVEAYRGLVDALENNRADLAPFAERNALKATAALWQVMNGLDQDPGHLYEIGA